MTPHPDAALYDAMDPFFAALGSSRPTPGGGAVAALAGQLAAALTHMVGALTIGKKNYAAVEPMFIETQAVLERAIAEFKSLAIADGAAFDGVMAAYALPRADDAAKARRKAAIQAAAAEAVTIPLRTLEACGDLLPAVQRAADHGNLNVVSDAGVAAFLIICAAKSAALNVRVNLPLLDETTRARDAARQAALLPAVLEGAAAAEEAVFRRLPQ